MGSVCEGSNERSESPQPFFPPPPPPRRESNPNIALPRRDSGPYTILPSRPPLHNSCHGNGGIAQTFVFEDRNNQLPMPPSPLTTNNATSSFNSPPNSVLNLSTPPPLIDSNRKSESNLASNVNPATDKEEVFTDNSSDVEVDGYLRALPLPPPSFILPPPKPPTRTFSKSSKLGRYCGLVCEFAYLPFLLFLSATRFSAK